MRQRGCFDQKAEVGLRLW